MKKTSKLAILMLSGLAVSALTSCGEGKDTTVNKIKIVDGSIAKSYYLDSTPDYTKLKIDTFNKSNEKIETIKIADNKTAFTYTEIDTSSLGEGKVFTLTYKINDLSFTDSMNYSVIDHDYTLTGWAENANYTQSINPLVNEKLSESEDNLETGFLKKGKYYIGNQNAANLTPEINALDEELRPVKVDTIPDGVSIKLYKDGEETELKPSDYIEDVTGFLKNGMLKFKKTVTGAFDVVLHYGDWKDVTYKVNVVDAYNVSKGTDLYALSSCMTRNTDWPYSSNYAKLNVALREYKKKLGLPDVSSLAFQNDITMNKSDLPEAYIWGDDAESESVKGSFKDWVRVIDYTFQKEGEAVVYGNSHRLSINDKVDDPDAFPYILTESTQGFAQKANEPISTHSNFIYASFAEGVDPTKCTFRIQDLEASGNMGVSAESTIKIGGPMLTKSEVTCDYDNVVVSKFYMALMGNGSGEKNKLVGKTEYDIQPTLNVRNCRFRDTFNASVYMYAGGVLNIENSEMVKAGGPLLFLNPRTEEFPYPSLDVSSLAKTEVNIDKKSFFSNRVEGKGGWFSAYSAESIVGAIKTMNNLFAPLRMSFMRKDIVDKFNFIMVNLPINEESIILPNNKGGVNTTVRRDGKVIYSTLDGYMDVFQKAQAYEAASKGTQQEQYLAGRALCSSLGNTFFGNNYSYSNKSLMALFATTGGDGTHEFVVPTLKMDALQRSEYAILNAKGIASSEDSPTPKDGIKNEGFLAASLIWDGNANSLQGNGTDSALPNLPAYKGVCNYGILFGDYHAI